MPRNEAGDPEDESFDDYMQRENAREGKPLPRGPGRPRSYFSDAEDARRRNRDALKRALNDDGRFRNVGSSAESVG